MPASVLPHSLATRTDQGFLKGKVTQFWPGLEVDALQKQRRIDIDSSDKKQRLKKQKAKISEIKSKD